MNQINYDIVVVGSGPAGLTAGLYAARGGKSVAVVGAGLGGTASLIHNIENFSGVKGSDGFSLAYTISEQAKSFGAQMISEDVRTFFLNETPKRMVLSSGKELLAKAVILAMGTQYRMLGLPNEAALRGAGVSYCATCDGNFFRGQTVVVNGGGNTAVTDALYLAGIAKEVYLVHRRQEFRATKVLVDRLKSSSVKLILDSKIEELKGNPLETVVVKNILTGEKTEIAAAGIFIAIGTLPNSDLVQEQVATDEQGYIQTDTHLQTSIPDVYAAGDVRTTPLRQVITACADGAIAATAACESF